MVPRIKSVIAIALILVLCHAALNQGAARVVQSGKNNPVNPPVEVGGYRPTKSPNNISYDFIVAPPFGYGYGWFAPCVLWSWNLMQPFRLHRPRPIGPPMRISPQIAPLPGFPSPFR